MHNLPERNLICEQCVIELTILVTPQARRAPGHLCLCSITYASCWVAVCNPSNTADLPASLL